MDDGLEAGGGVFPVPEESLEAGMDWWNSLPSEDQGYWMLMAESVSPAAARHAYLLKVAYSEAFREANNWANWRENALPGSCGFVR